LLDNKSRNKIIPQAVKKLASLEYKYMEDPDSIDLLNRVYSELDKKITMMFMDSLNLISFVVYVIGIMVSLFTQMWWVTIIMAVSALPLILIASKSGKESFDTDREMTRSIRQFNYLAEIMTSRESIEERNIFGYIEFLNRRYIEKFEIYRMIRLKVSLRHFFKYKIVAMLSIAYIAIAVLILINSVSGGDMSLGVFIALIVAVVGLADRLSQGIESDVKNLVKNREFLVDLTKAMALNETPGALSLPQRQIGFKTIEFRNVSFKYPGTEKVILDGISFIIERGNHYSFVGENGTGKTTITKLITGLYTNYEGDILVDGKCLKTMTQGQIKGLTTLVYQDFAKYYISLKENIFIGSLNKPVNDTELKSVLELLNLSEPADKLKNGLDTPLGKVMENGADVSHGEWQRIAMARSSISDAPLKILDEPTAALDPVSESMVYKNFEEITKKDENKTVIFISHRLGSTKLADCIYVLSGGKVVENGNHDALISNNGLYAQMYKSQAQWYIDSDEGAKHD
jgi:ATP-binding cassette subfamily B protein